MNDIGRFCVLRLLLARTLMTGARLPRTMAQCTLDGGLVNHESMLRDMERNALLLRPLTELWRTNATALGGFGDGNACMVT
jgi:hypothetical protein